jgi:hypothetical protein
MHMRFLFLTLASLMLHSSAIPPTTGAARPVVLELFTSQGCSSCPRADALLSTLARDRNLSIIPLGFHVDYWDHLGWRDPYSSAVWSARQGRYASAFHSSSLYTPQIVVDGSSEYVGSNERDIRAAVQRAMRVPFAVQTAITTTERKANQLHVTFEARPSADLARDANALVAIVESGLETAVARGENSGRHLHDDFVVRSLSEGGVVRRVASARTQRALDIPLDPRWKQPSVVLLIVDPGTQHVIGAATRQLQ